MGRGALFCNNEANRKLNSVNHDYTMDQVNECEVRAQFAADISEKRPFVEARLEDAIDTNVLVDTGSSLNVINEMVLKEIETKLGYNIARMPSDLILKTFAGSCVGQLGCVILNVDFGTCRIEAPFVIVQSSSTSPCILGARTFVRLRMQMTWNGSEDLILTFADHKFIAKVHLYDNIHPLYAVSEVTVLPRESTLVPVKFVAAMERKHNYCRTSA